MLAGGVPTDRLIVFDTTLRDGEQSPGVTLTADEKVEIARQLSLMNVDVCEAGFPVASKGDLNAVQRIAREIGPLVAGRPDAKPMTICALARAVPADINQAFEAIRDAPSHRIHTFLATSDIHLKHKLKLTREQCVKQAVEAVRYAKNLCQDIEFSPEDAGRSDRQFLCQVLGAVIEAGATTINIPDTVGYNTPEEFGSLMRYLIENTAGADQVVWSTHCHNDLGLATANTLAGVMNGARQVEVTINGIGERAGNTALEEVIMAIYTHPTYYPVRTAIDPSRIYKTSQLIVQKTGMLVQPNKAIVGANAFAHESGIHQDGVLKCEQTYEIIQPAVVGVPKSQLVLGKHSGRNAFRTRLLDLGYAELADDKPRFERLFQRFKAAADAKSRLMDDDLVALVEDELGHAAVESFSVKFIQIVSNVSEPGAADAAAMMAKTTDANDSKDIVVHSSLSKSTSASSSSLPIDNTSCYASTATATVTLIHNVDQRELSDAAIGRGPVDALFKCINRLVGLADCACLVQYEVKSVTEGQDALGCVHVRLCRRRNGDGDDGAVGTDKCGKTAHGRGTHWDILTASAIAYVDAVNRLLITTAL